MKTIVFLLVITVLFSCTDAEIQEMNNSLAKVEKKVTHEQNEIIGVLTKIFLTEAQIKEEEKLWNATSRSGRIKLDDLSAESFKNLKFTTLPYYEFDEDSFIEDPSPENLMNCIKPFNNRVLFLGKKGNEIMAVTEAIKLNDRWVRGQHLEGIDYFKNYFAWFPRKIAEENVSDFYFLDAIGSLFVVIFCDGEPYFYSFIGSYMYNKKVFAMIMLNSKNTKEVNKRYFEKLKSQLDSIKE